MSGETLMKRFTAWKILPALLIIVFSLFAATCASALIWVVPNDFGTIQEAIDSDLVLEGDRIIVRPGRYFGAVVDKNVTIVGRYRCVINDGPMPFSGPWADLKTGFYFPDDGSGSGSKIKGFIFKGIQFPVFASRTDGVRVARNKMRRPTQGITNWGGSGWIVRNNVIRGLRVDSGGGIGVFIGDWEGIPKGVTGNLVVRNRIRGYLNVESGETGGYEGAGIALFADFRGGADGAVYMSWNKIIRNRIYLNSTDPLIVDIWAIWVSEYENPDPFSYVIRENRIMRNRLRGGAHKIFLLPDELAGVNTVQGRLTTLYAESPSPPLIMPGVSPIR